MAKHERANLKQVVVTACNNTNKCICKNHTQMGSSQNLSQWKGFYKISFVLHSYVDAYNLWYQHT
jgi:hypothetical protein